MSTAIEFAINIKRGLLMASELSGEPYELKLYTGEVKPLLITIVTDLPSSGWGSLQVIPASGIALTVGIIKNDLSGVLTSTTFAAAGPNTFAGDLVLNVAAFSGLTYPYDGFLEANIIIGSEIIKVQMGQRIYKGVLDTALGPTPAPDTAIGHAEADQLYVRKRGDFQFIMTDSDDGTEQLITLRGGQFQISPIT